MGEELSCLRHQLLLGFDLDDAEPEAAVRLFQYARQTECGNHLIEIFPMHHQRLRRRDVMPRHELVQVHLVRALEDRIGIVDDGHAERCGTPRELVRVLPDIGRGSDEQRVEVIESVQRAGTDELSA